MLAFFFLLLIEATASQVPDATSTFDDMGKMMFYGFAIALVAATGLAWLMIRLRNKVEESQRPISITGQSRNDG